MCQFCYVDEIAIFPLKGQAECWNVRPDPMLYKVRSMQIKCPECEQPIEVISSRLPNEVVCERCKKNLKVIGRYAVETLVQGTAVGLSCLVHLYFNTVFFGVLCYVASLPILYFFISKLLCRLEAKVLEAEEKE